VTYVEDHVVTRKIKNAAKGNGQLQNAQIGRQVSAGFRNLRDEKAAQLFG
jgi:hypothetical protein